MGHLHTTKIAIIKSYEIKWPTYLFCRSSGDESSTENQPSSTDDESHVEEEQKDEEQRGGGGAGGGGGGGGEGAGATIFLEDAFNVSRAIIYMGIAAAKYMKKKWKKIRGKPKLSKISQLDGATE